MMMNERTDNKQTVSRQTELLAKLMATENIDVEFKQVETAYFDLKSRHLVLPIYEGLSDDVYAMMLSHEISHALNTPYDEWGEYVGESKGRAMYANVIEDARIERLIKKRYPGVVKEMARGYKELHEKNFFGIDADEDLSERKLIDRINLYFKSYGNLNVPFSEDEETFLEDIQNAKTFKDVTEISERIIAYSDENEPEQQAQMDENGETAEYDENGGDLDGEPGERSDEDGEENSNYSDDQTTDSEGDSEETERGEDTDDVSENGDDSTAETTDGSDSKETDDDEDAVDNSDSNRNVGKDGSNSSEPSADDVDSQKNLDENLKRNALTDDPDRTVTGYLTNSWVNENWERYVVPFEDFVSAERRLFNDHREMVKKYRYHAGLDTEAILKTSYNKLRKTTNKVVMNMVKEFEMKKSADMLQKTTVSKTGTIDNSRLHQYRTSDDIFLREEHTPEGKNHGVIMYLDFSGSMNGIEIVNALGQVFNMVMFCDKVGIPYRVFGFTNSYHAINSYDVAGELLYENSRKWNTIAPKENGEKGFSVAMNNNTRLLEILNSNGNKRDRMFAMSLIATILNTETNGYARYNFVYQYLGGTPLNTSLYIAPFIVNDFKRRNKLDKVTFLLYTDGSAGDHLYHFREPDNFYSGFNLEVALRLVDPITKKYYHMRNVIRSTGNSQLQNVLTQRIKDMTGSAVVAYYVGSKRYKEQFAWAASQLANSGYTSKMSYSEEIKNNGLIEVKNVFGYDSYNYVLTETVDAHEYTIEDELKGDVKDASTRKIEGAFVRANRKTNNSRVLVKKLMDVLA